MAAPLALDPLTGPQTPDLWAGHQTADPRARLWTTELWARPQTPDTWAGPNHFDHKVEPATKNCYAIITETSFGFIDSYRLNFFI